MMAGPLRRALLVAVLAAQLVALAAVAPARGVSILWTLTVTPLTATTGVQRTFTLTATNEDPLAALSSDSEIGCVVVDVPGTFTVAGAAVTGSRVGESWHVDSVAGNRVTVHTDSGGDRLELLDWVAFTITATPFNTGSLGWNARALRQQDCTGGAALLGVTPVVIVTGAAPTPTPTPRPTPSPTPRPTPTPTPSPTPTPKPTPTPLLGTLPPTPSLPLPSLPVPSLGTPSSPSPSPSPGSRDVDGEPSASRVPAASTEEQVAGSPRPSDSGGDDDGAPPDGGEGPIRPGGDDDSPGEAGHGGSAPAPGEGEPASVDSMNFPIDRETGELGVEISGIDVLAGPVWAVPAATIAGPGLLVLLWLLLQAIGAAAWMPSVRRLRGDERAEARSA